MASPTHVLERAKHAAHARGDHADVGPLGKWVGVTMAVLGALLTFTTLLSSTMRTELLSTTVEQSNAIVRHESAANRYRMLISQLQQLHALTADPAELAATTEELSRAERSVSREASPVVRVVRLETQRVLSTLTPSPTDLVRFVTIARKYRAERDAAQKWSDTYQHAVETSDTALNRYEWAGLLVEIAIVLCSFALLVSSRRVWIGACVVGVFGLVAAVGTHVSAAHEAHAQRERIVEAKAYLDSLATEAKEQDSDEALLRDVEAGR